MLRTSRDLLLVYNNNNNYLFKSSLYSAISWAIVTLRSYDHRQTESQWRASPNLWSAEFETSVEIQQRAYARRKWQLKSKLHIIPNLYIPWDSSPLKKKSHRRTRNRTRDHLISSQWLWPLDQEAGHNNNNNNYYYYYFKCYPI